MDTTELLKRIRRIEIKTRALSQHIFSGQYHSIFKGRGIAFTEVREYQYGDEIRFIDWNVTARFNHPYVKVFEEERELTLILLIDISKSESFGTKVYFKRDLIAEISAVLAFSALQNNDKVGAILFTDKVEKFIVPKKGRSHILHIIRELLYLTPSSDGTNIANALQYLYNSIKKRAIVFLITDFFDTNFEEALKIVGRKHDTIAIQIVDKAEMKYPEIGLILVKDAETGKTFWVDSSDKALSNKYQIWWHSRQVALQDSFRRCNVDHIQIFTDEQYITPLINFFRRRSKRV
ncbi:MAG: DUF58 domain-containing protein [Ignavibacteria bacterium]|nr:DUF58 domain-containing protein [Ignavibacteria bacterium]